MNKKDLLLKRINILEEVKNNIQNEIKYLYDELKILDDNIQETNIRSSSPKMVHCSHLDKRNEDLFVFYLTDVKKLSNGSTRSNYLTALKNMKILMQDYFNVVFDFEFYHVDDLNFFADLIEKFDTAADLKMINLKRHHVISAAYNNYYEFLQNKKM